MYLPNVTAVALGALAVNENTKRGIVTPLRRAEKPAFKTHEDLAHYAQHTAANGLLKLARGAQNFHANEGRSSAVFSVESANALVQNITSSRAHPEKRAAQGPLSSHEGYYTAEFTFGSAGVPIPVDPDTGSADIWVPEHEKNSPLYDPASSTTGKNTGRTFSLQYGDGTSVQCDIYTDTIGFAGLSTTTDFGIATRTDAGLYGGLAGLAWQSISSGKTPEFVQSLFKTNAISENLFAMNLKRRTLEVGGYDRGAYKGELVWQSLTEKSYWAVPEIGIWHNGISVINFWTSILDSGTTAIVVPFDTAFQFWSLYAFAVPFFLELPTIFWLFPCGQTFGTIEVTFGSLRVPLSAEDLNLGQELGVCVGSIYGSASDIVIIGDTFMDKVYTVFDYANARVGAAIAN